MKKGEIVEDVETRSRLNADGHEILDNSPVAIPVKFKRVDAITQKVAELVQGEFSRLAEKEGYETFEDADDFDVGDDYDPHSPYELNEEQEYYDHRNDPRLKSKEGPADKGEGEDREVIQRDGEETTDDSKGDKSDKRNSGEVSKVKKSKSVKGGERSVP